MAKQFGLVINVNKTKNMLVTKDPVANEELGIAFGRYPFDRVDSFTNK